MAVNVEFEDFTFQVEEAMEDAVTAFLHDAGNSIASQAARNSRIRTGETAGSFTYQVDDHEAQIGSPLENAIWEEFGTGEYALHGDGRKGGWFYKDEKGEGHFTSGKTPNRALQTAFDTKKGAIQNRAQEILRERLD